MIKKNKISKHAIQKSPKYLLGSADEVLALWDITNNGQDILSCRNFEDYTNLCKRLRNKHKLGPYWTQERITGIAFGQSFFNFWLITFGKMFGLYFKKPAKAYQDKNEATDSWCVDKKGFWVRVNLKWLVNRFQHIHFEKYATFLAQMSQEWLNQEQTNQEKTKVLIMDGQLSADWKTDKWIEDTSKASHKRIGYKNIDISIGNDNRSFFNDFYETLEDNVDYFEKRRQLAIQKADQKRQKYLSDCDAIDTQDIQTLKSNEKGAAICCPGWTKTKLSAFGSFESRLEMGPMYYFSRVKQLVEQNVTECVELVRPVPERLLVGSFDSHEMDLKPAFYVGPFDPFKDEIINLHKNKTPAIIGAVTYGAKQTMNKILQMHIDNEIPLRAVCDEALEVFRANVVDTRDDEEATEMLTTLDLLEKLNAMGLLHTWHIYDAIFIDGQFGMNAPGLGLPKEPLFKHTHQEGQQTNRLVPLHVIHHLIPESVMKKARRKKEFSQFTDSQILEAHGILNTWRWIKNKKDVAKLLAFNSNVDMGRTCKAELERLEDPTITGEIFANTTPERRRTLQGYMNDPLMETAVFNYNITAKGMNYPMLEDIVIAPDQITDKGLAWHKFHRHLRRAIGEFGLPLSKCKKQKGTLHLIAVDYEDGSMSPSMRINEQIVEDMKKKGLLVIEQYVKVNATSLDSERTYLEFEREKQDTTITTDDEVTSSFQVVEVPDSVQKHRDSVLKQKEVENFYNLSAKEKANKMAEILEV